MIRDVYFHAVEGRMRIHIAEVKGSQARAREIEDRLGCCCGIASVSANPITGNVLITYDSNRISQGGILGLLREAGRLGERETFPVNPLAKAHGNSQWSTMLVRAALEVALSALIL